MDQTNFAKRILIVDDNSEAADITTELLHLCGYQTAVAYSGAQGLQSAMEFEPDVILLDLGMPGMDGYQVAAALRALPAFQDVALIAFTAWGDPATRQKARDSGFDQHITKPATLDAMLRAIDNACLLRSGFDHQMA